MKRIRCALALAGLAMVPLTAPAYAGSPVVGPVHHDVFVIGPADGGACSFPVQWDVVTKDLGLDRPPSFLSGTPDWHLTLTNVDTGKTWSPHGDGTITYQDQADGSVLQTARGVNYAPLFDVMLVGSWTRYYYPDTNTFSTWEGSGKIVDICAQLS